jgi:hypothetical protein
MSFKGELSKMIEAKIGWSAMSERRVDGSPIVAGSC